MTSSAANLSLAKLAMVPLVLCLGACGATLKPVTFPAAPSLAAMEPVTAPAPPREATLAPSLHEDVVEVRSLPNLSGKGLTLTGASSAVSVSAPQARGVLSGLDSLSSKLAMVMLRSGFSRFLDERRMRPIKSRKESGAPTNRLILSGQLHKLAMVEKIPRLDYILSVKWLAVHRVKKKERRPARLGGAEVKRYLKALRAVIVKRNEHVRSVDAARGSYVAAFERATTQANSQYDMLSASDKAEINARYQQAKSKHSEILARLSRQRARLYVKLPRYIDEKKRLEYVTSDMAYCTARVTLVDAATGETLAALTYRRRHEDGKEALMGVINTWCAGCCPAPPG